MGTRSTCALTAWIMIGAAWMAALALPFLQTPERGAVLVVFPPWMSAEAQLDGLIDADLYILERPAPFMLTGYAAGNWRGDDSLRRAGALLITGASEFPLCSTKVEPASFKAGQDI